MTQSVYYLSYGVNGEIDRFQAPAEIAYGRRQRVVARSSRGLELGTVLGPADSGAVETVSTNVDGRILRPASRVDELQAQDQRKRAGQIFEDARDRAVREDLPIEILDVEVLLDGKQAVLHYVAWGPCDPRGLMDKLSDEYRLLVVLHDLAPKAAVSSCGSGGCGSGGCGSCGSGGCGSCTNEPHVDAHSPRVSLV
jgi:cell fate regulator YaaT (PSP1 superfamily)